MKNLDVFQLCCMKIAENLFRKHFKSTKKGQFLKKKSKDKKLIFEIFLQSSFNPLTKETFIWPHVTISSNLLKKWQIEKYGIENVGRGEIFSTRLESLTPLQNNISDWKITFDNYEDVANKITKLIEKYIIPVFNKFENLDIIIEDIKINGVKFNEYFDISYQNLPIDFLYYFGGEKVAEIAFNNYIKKQRLIVNAKRIYTELTLFDKSKIKNVTDLTIRKAFYNDLKIF